MAKIKGIVAGAAIGTLIGSLGAILLPHRKKILEQMKDQSKGWAEKAKYLTENAYDEIKHWSEPRRRVSQMPNFLRGTLLGALLGAGSALLLAPKSGKQLRNNLTQKYQNVAEKTQEFIHSIQLNGQREFSRRKPIKRKTKKHRPSKMHIK